MHVVRWLIARNGYRLVLVVNTILVGVAIAEFALVSAAQPVVTGELTHRAAVETAARSTVEILSTSYEDYDEQGVDEISRGWMRGRAALEDISPS